jgi:hypothetical protein
MNLYDGSDGDDVRPDKDFDTDMITMNPPRWRPWRPGRPIAVAGVAVVALAAGGGVGYAATHSVAQKAADTAAVSTKPSSAPSAVAPGPAHRFGKGFRVFGGGPFGGFGFGPFGGGVIHGQFTAPKSGGGYQTLDMQRGTVTAVSGTSISVKSADGFSASYTVTSKTLVDAQAAGIGSVKKGDSVVVIATVSGSTATAADVMDLSAIKSGRASFGFRTGPGDPEMAPVPAPAAQAPSA